MGGLRGLKMITPGCCSIGGRHHAGMTVTDLHELAPPNTVYDWLHNGSRPDTGYRTALAHRFSGMLRRSPDEVRRLLNRHYALAAIARRLRPYLGGFLSYLGAKFEEFTQLVDRFLADPGHTLSEEQLAYAEHQLALHGVGFKSSRSYIVRSLRRMEDTIRSGGRRSLLNVVD